MKFDRNIVTEKDAEKFRAVSAPPAITKGMGLYSLEVETTTAPMPSADDYLTKLLKYLPLEVLGVYLFLATLVKQNVTGASSLARWLLGLLVFTVVVTCLYDYFVLNVKRAVQIVMSGIGIAVYVLASGDWFATTNWYHPWYGTAALPIYALLIQFIKLGPLPNNS